MKKLTLLLFLLTACAPAAATATPTLPPPKVSVATFVPTASAVPLSGAATPLPTPAEPGPALFNAADGTPLAATFYPPVSQPAPGVLLLHMLGGSKADWEPVARTMQQQGLAVLAMDLRGHGQSGGAQDWTKAPGDVRAGWDWMVSRPEVDAKRSAIVGASIGANLALIVGANNPDVVTVVALSPGQDFRGLQPAGVLKNFGERPVLLVASQDDGYSYDSVRQMVSLAPLGEAYYFAAAGHGTFMFSDPSLEPLIIDWLQRYTGALKG